LPKAASICSWTLAPTSAVHTRFLYEPDLYLPRHPYDDIFDGIFGRDRLQNDRQDLCSIGFEPNPLHRLVTRTWPMRSLLLWCERLRVTPGDKLTFYRQDKGEDNDWGFSLKNLYGGKNAEKHDVPIISLATFVNEHVGRARPERVLMKMEVEGAEYSMMSEMLEMRSFDYIDKMTYEFHARFCPLPVQLADGVHEFSEPDCQKYGSKFPGLLSAEFNTTLSEIDDEQHRQDGRAWPNPT